jgi:chaperonin cofactor prefoldin
MLYFEGLLKMKSDTALGDETTALATAICKVIEDNATGDNAIVTLDQTNKTLTFKPAIAGYPEMMPAGSAVLGIETGSGVESFTYVLPNDDSYFVNATALNVPAKARYVYPANLYYFGNSGILVSKELKTDLYDADETTGSTSKVLWEKIANKTNFAEGTKITSETKSIAIKDQVQYAVGRLDVKVSTYKDANGHPTELNDATEKVENKVSIDNLKLTGVLIGGQRAVNWKFDSENSSTGEFIIYDNIIKSCNLDDNDPATNDGIAVTNSAFANITNTSTATGFNHTLVLQTRKYTAGSPATGDQTVNVLLEFQNNGKAFEGKDGTIGKGCKFYLLGVLDMTKITGSALSDYIFQQDYITCANFTIASLENAVNVIPDLRDPQIELGLSVNLTWQQGNTFDVTIN